MTEGIVDCGKIGRCERGEIVFNMIYSISSFNYFNLIYFNFY